MYRQYKLTCGAKTEICWLENTKLGVGTKLTLLDLPGTWTVAARYSTSDICPEKDWAVGGLEKRKRRNEDKQRKDQETLQRRRLYEDLKQEFEPCK